ncbi:unnamed protein product [Ectocarpus fasciculatus]
MALSPLDPFLLENGFVVLDGGLATELEAQGADLTGDLWSAALLADNPSLIRNTHLAYYRAGADVATSASYQASFEGFLRKGVGPERAKELLLLSVRLAVEARNQFWADYQEERPASRPAATKPQALQQQQQPSQPTATAVEWAEEENGQRAALSGPNYHEEGRRQHRRRRLRPLVAASLGCYGAVLADGSEYRGDYVDTPAGSLEEFHAKRLEVLATADGVDMVVFETVPCLAEVRAILSLLQARGDFRPRVSAVISVSCKDDEHLRSGERVQDFADLIWRRAADQDDTEGPAAVVTTTAPPARVVAVGVNCTSPSHAAGALRTLAAARARPDARRSAPRENPPRIALVAYPNSGEEWDAGARDWVEGTGLREGGVGGGAEEFGRMARDEWFAAGARVVGGCCRTGQAHVAEVRRALASAAEEKGLQGGEEQQRSALQRSS